MYWLEQTVSDFDQYLAHKDRCRALLALTHDKLVGDSHHAFTIDADTLQQRMETLKACIYVFYDICK